MRARFLLAFALSALACDQSLSPQDNAGAGGASNAATGVGTGFGSQLCQRFSDCALSTCDPSEIAPVVLSSDCQSKLLAAACPDLQATVQTCFPACATPGTASCNSDGSLTECTATGFQQRVACEGVCAVKSQKYTGTCGTTYMSMTSHSPICWCQ
jgi:hypothetical protein